MKYNKKRSSVSKCIQVSSKLLKIYTGKHKCMIVDDKTFSGKNMSMLI